MSASSASAAATQAANHKEQASPQTHLLSMHVHTRNASSCIACFELAFAPLAAPIRKTVYSFSILSSLYLCSLWSPTLHLQPVAWVFPAHLLRLCCLLHVLFLSFLLWLSLHAVSFLLARFL